MRALTVAVVGVLCSLVMRASASRLDAAMYKQYSAQNGDIAYCSTFFNITSRVGCFSRKGGVEAPLFAFVGDDGVEKEMEGMAVIVPESQLNDEIVKRLIKVNVAALLIARQDDDPPRQFSPTAPSRWNPKANNLRWTAVPFPIIYLLNATASAEAFAKAEWNLQNNGHTGYPREVVFLDAYSGPAVMNFRRCTQLGRCSLLGDFSVWATLGVSDAREKVWAAAPMDAISLFMEGATGANAAGAGYVAILAAADALKKASSTHRLRRQPAFALLNGEAFGQMGSGRFAWALKNLSCPKAAEKTGEGRSRCDYQEFFPWAAPMQYDLPLEFMSLGNLTKYILAVDQVGAVEADGKMKVRSAAAGSASALAEVAPGSIVGLSDANAPPTPADAFVSQGLLPKTRVAVMTGYNNTYSETNRYYGSRWDDDEQVTTESITVAATSIARMMWALCSADSLDDAASIASAARAVPVTLKANTSLVSVLSSCVVSKGGWKECPLLSVYIPSGMYTTNLNKRVPNWSPMSSSTLRDFAREFLAMATSSSEQLSGKACPDWNSTKCGIAKTGHECVAKQCLLSSSWYFQALPEGSRVLPNGAVNFAESERSQLWGSARITARPLQMYRKEAPWYNWIVLAVGMIVFAGSWFMTKALASRVKAKLL
eukprot:g222.t1